MGSPIRCCKNCVQPKRHPGCHSNCPEYLKEKAAYDELKKAADQKCAISAGITAKKLDTFYKSIKRRKRY